MTSEETIRCYEWDSGDGNINFNCKWQGLESELNTNGSGSTCPNCNGGIFIPVEDESKESTPEQDKAAQDSVAELKALFH